MFNEAVQVIGVGQCGCRIGKNFENLGVNTKYINSDEIDLRNFSGNPNSVLLIEGSGTGGSPVKGEQLFKKHKKTIINFLDEGLDPDKIIWVIWGSGGGTGNSIGPLLLEHYSKKYKTGCITTLPPKMLGILPSDNAMRTIKKIKNLNLSMCVLADNEYLISKIGISNNWWERVNQHIVATVTSAFDLLRHGKITQDGLGSIDRGEVMRILQYGQGMTDIRSVYLTPQEFNLEDKQLLELLFTSSLVQGYNYKNTLAYLVGVDIPEIEPHNIAKKKMYIDISKRIFDITKGVAGSSISRLGMFVDPILTDTIRVTMVNAGLKLPKILQSKINNLKRDGERFVEKKTKEETLNLDELGESVLDDNFEI
jgi:cell division GTPase FtsZ